MSSLDSTIIKDLGAAAASDAMDAVIRKARLAPADLQLPIIAVALALIDVKRQSMAAGLGSDVGTMLTDLHSTIIAERMEVETGSLRSALSRAGVPCAA